MMIKRMQSIISVEICIWNKNWLYRRNYHWKWCKKDEIISNIKNYYCFVLLLAFGQFPGHDHTILVNEHQQKYDVIMSKYVT